MLVLTYSEELEELDHFSTPLKKKKSNIQTKPMEKETDSEE